MILIDEKDRKAIIELIEYRMRRLRNSNWSSNYRDFELNELDKLKSKLVRGVQYEKKNAV